MAEFQVTGVELSDSANGHHKHIRAICIGLGKIKLPQATVARNLRDPNGDRYYTYANGERTHVHVVNCPDCAAGDYLTTSPDSTTANNLLSLLAC